MKYDAQLTELKTFLPTAKSVLIALPVGADIDKLAAGLALYLIFKLQGKEVTISSDDTITVGQSHLFAVDRIQKNLPAGQSGGNLTISLEDVASQNGTIPSLEKLDWYAENNNLNLVFHVLPGQTFQPTRIVPQYQGGGFNVIFVVGAANLDSLGAIYKQNLQVFSGVHVVNIDNQNNTGFGTTNVVDTNASSVSEIVANVITDLGMMLDADTASNLLTGVFDATNNLTNTKVSADTYLVVANLLRVGGKKPGIVAQPPVSTPPQPSLSALIPPEPVVSSPEERPMQEGVISETPEPDWLTPKIFKGTSIG